MILNLNQFYIEIDNNLDTVSDIDNIKKLEYSTVIIGIHEVPNSNFHINNGDLSTMLNINQDYLSNQYIL